MADEPLTDDQSHYEVSLTAGQAFLAFVLLLLSLAASFAFGLVIGKGQSDDKIMARRDATVVNEASLIPKKPSATAADVAVRDDDFKQPEIKEEPMPKPQLPVAGDAPPATGNKRQATPKPATTTPKVEPKTEPRTANPEPRIPHYAQLLSTSDQKTAEALAAKLIDGGFTSAYVERAAATEKGMIYRVRVKFPSEEEARAAEARLKTFSKDVWITK